MAVLAGYATFPGIDQVVSATYTLSHGITPGTAVLELAPQLNFTGALGPLIFTFGEFVFEFADCLVVQHSIRRGGDGLIWSLSVLDRRWAWVYGSISGSYNVRLDDDTLDPDYQLLPVDLMTLCLAAMGETGYDLSQVPNNTYPPTNWDHANPARALADLADQLGCRVVLQIDGTVKVAQTGLGLDLPTAGVMVDGESLATKPAPDAIQVVCGKTRYQSNWLLTPLGQDTDGTIKLITQLSYAPKNGWGNEVPPHFWGVPDTPTKTGQVPREFAQRTVFRWYGIANQNLDGTSPLQIPGYGPIQSLRQIFPIEDEQVLTFVNLGKVQNLPAWVYGVYFSGDLGFINTPQGTYYTKGFSVNRELGIVEFSDYVFKFVAGGTITWADLALTCALSVRDAATWTWNRHEVTWFNPSAVGTGPRILKHDEIQLNVCPIKNGQTNPTGVLQTNQVAVDTEANYYLAAAQLDYQLTTPEERTYMGLVPINPDGAIQQVTWSVSNTAGATTRASRNNEWNPAVPPYRERRIFEDLRAGAIHDLKAQLAQIARQGGQGT